MLVPFAQRITVSLPDSLSHFPAVCFTVTGESGAGHPYSRAAASVAWAPSRWSPTCPTLLVTGGGTGALALNRIVAGAVPQLAAFCQIVHLTGRGRAVAPPRPSSRYHTYEFLTAEMPMPRPPPTSSSPGPWPGTFHELAALRKPALIVPMPGSHQLANARAYAALGAADVAQQPDLTAESLAARVRDLLTDQPRRQQMGVAALGRAMPGDVAERLAHCPGGRLASAVSA